MRSEEGAGTALSHSIHSRLTASATTHTPRPPPSRYPLKQYAYPSASPSYSCLIVYATRGSQPPAPAARSHYDTHRSSPPRQITRDYIRHHALESPHA